jgi:hypothetical protein
MLLKESCYAGLKVCLVHLYLIPCLKEILKLICKYEINTRSILANYSFIYLFLANRVVSKSSKCPKQELLRYNLLYLLLCSLLCNCFSRLRGFDVKSISTYFQAHPCSAVILNFVQELTR